MINANEWYEVSCVKPGNNRDVLISITHECCDCRNHLIYIQAHYDPYNQNKDYMLDDFWYLCVVELTEFIKGFQNIKITHWMDLGMPEEY